MNDILVYVGIGIMLIAVVIAYQYSNIRFTRVLSLYLYQELDAKKYIDSLDSLRGRIFIRRKRRELLKLDAYAFMDDNANLQNQFDSLEGMNLSYGQKITLYEKEVQYYATNNMHEKAITAYNSLMELGNQIDDEKMTRILDEATLTMEVYVNRNGDYAEKLVELGKSSTNPIIKGLYFYKASKCYSYKNDKNNVIKYLKKAQNNLSSKKWRDHIDTCLSDFSNLEKL